MSTKTGALAKECRRQEESCLWTSTSLFYWLVFLRFVKVLVTVTSLTLGAFGSWKILTESNDPSTRTFVAVCSFIAGLLPTIYAGLKWDDYLAHAEKLTGEFKNLQDGFRRCALVSSRKPFNEFEAEANALFQRLEQAKAPSITAPEIPFFWIAKWKLKSGDYNFSVDSEMKDL